MELYQVHGNQLIGGVKVPLMGGCWKYLDWRMKVGTKAPKLCSPYGPNHFHVGGAPPTIVTLDFAELPDGSIMMEMEADPNLGFHCEDAYNVFRRGDALAASHFKITKILDRLAELGVSHDAEQHGADAWYFMRAVGKELKLPAYAAMSDHQLRFGA
jgi:hypothetical protein